MLTRSPTLEEKRSQRLLRELDTHAVEGWQVLGLLGEPSTYPGSLDQLYLHRGGRARWWKADSGISQIRFNPVKYQARIPKARALPADRLVHGSAVLLLGLTCHPEKTSLVRMLTEIRKRLAS